MSWRNKPMRGNGPRAPSWCPVARPAGGRACIAFFCPTLSMTHPTTPWKDIHVIALSPRRLPATGPFALGLLAALVLVRFPLSARADASTLELETLTGAQRED